MKYIQTNKAPKAIGPYSQAIMIRNFIFCSGQIGIDPKTNILRQGIENQTNQTLSNLKSVIEISGSSIDNVVKTTIYLKKIKDFNVVNKLYSEFFGNHKPARVTIEVSDLPKDALIEIEAIAIVTTTTSPL